MVNASSKATKSALIDASLQLFAEKGFAATSTREIAAAANTNIGSITYHFGGKNGLRLACAEFIVSHLSRLKINPDTLKLPSLISEAETGLEELILSQAYIFLTFPEAQNAVPFLMREAQEQSEAFEHIYEQFFEPTHKRLCHLWADATGKDPEDETVRLVIFSLVGQITYFRIGEAVVSRRMQWQDQYQSHALEILGIIRTNIRAILDAYRRA